WMRHLDSRYGTNPAIVPGATQKNTNDPSTAPTVLVTQLLPHHAFVFAERIGAERPARRGLNPPQRFMPARSSGLLERSWRQPFYPGCCEVTDWEAHEKDDRESRRGSMDKEGTCRRPSTKHQTPRHAPNVCETGTSLALPKR